MTPRSGAARWSGCSSGVPDFHASCRRPKPLAVRTPDRRIARPPNSPVPFRDIAGRCHGGRLKAPGSSLRAAVRGRPASAAYKTAPAAQGSSGHGHGDLGDPGGGVSSIIKEPARAARSFRGEGWPLATPGFRGDALLHRLGCRWLSRYAAGRDAGAHGLRRLDTVVGAKDADLFARAASMARNATPHVWA